MMMLFRWRSMVIERNVRQAGAGLSLRTAGRATSRAQPARGIFNAKANQIAGKPNCRFSCWRRAYQFRIPTADGGAARDGLLNQRHFGEIFGAESSSCRVGALQFGCHCFSVSRFTVTKTPGADVQRRVAKPLLSCQSAASRLSLRS